jgi:hypothetical protein
MSKRYGNEQQAAPAGAVLPPERAFVVEFRSDGTTLQDEQLRGRVEHVVSGRAARFDSAAELLDFVRGVLRSGAQTKGGDKE